MGTRKDCLGESDNVHSHLGVSTRIRPITVNRVQFLSGPDIPQQPCKQVEFRPNRNVGCDWRPSFSSNKHACIDARHSCILHIANGFQIACASSEARGFGPQTPRFLAALSGFSISRNHRFNTDNVAERQQACLVLEDFCRLP